MGNDKVMKGIMVGAGSIAKHHMEGWKAIPDAEIVAVVDTDIESARRLIENHGVVSAVPSTDLAPAIDKYRPDFVDVLTPPDTHSDVVRLVADHGVDVLCQKPFTPSMDESKALIEYCRERGVRCIVNENWRWRSWYRVVRELLDDGIIGSPQSAAILYHTDRLVPDPGAVSPVDLQYTAGNDRLIVYEFGIHFIDVMRYLFGSITAIEARFQYRSDLAEGEDSAIINLEFDSGVEGIIDVSWASWTRPDRKLVRGSLEPLLIEGAKGSLELDPYQDDTMVLSTASGTSVRATRRDGESRQDAYQSSFTACQQNFIARVRDGQFSENDGEDNLNTLAAVFACYESAKLGKRIEVTS